MQRLLLLLVLCSGLLYAQDSVYESARARAQADSVITEDEQALLDLIQPIQDSSSITIDTTATPDVEYIQALNQEGRWRLIYSTMAVGNGLYGVGIPYVLGSHNANHYIGFQMVAAAGGFYLSYNETRQMDLSVGRAAFIERGAVIGFTSFFPLQAAIGIENWFDFDSEFKVGLSYMMLTIPVGAYFGNKLFDEWQPSDGQALVISAGSSLGMANGFAIHRFIYKDVDIDSEHDFNRSYRVISALGYGGALAGLYYTHKYMGNYSYSTGDAYLVNGSAILGLYTAGQLIHLAEIEDERSIILLGMVCVNGFAWQGSRLVEEVDLTDGDAAIVALGTFAANGIWRGLGIMADAEFSAKTSSALDVVTSIAGFYTTYNSVKTRRLSQRAPSETTNTKNMQLTPVLLGNFQNPIPGLSFELKW